ncbi:MAG: hypothetical protein RLZZ628_1596 [Bacteroidota bacterium]|jgi:hypothetical protein
MENAYNPLQDLKEIRTMMERSTRFISLSGLSGVCAGVCALLGAGAAYLYLDTYPFEGASPAYFQKAFAQNKWGMHYTTFFILDAAATIFLSILTAFYFTYRKAVQNQQSLFDRTALRLTANIGIPLVTGGVFCLALMYYDCLGFVAPATLVFYGLALVNGSKYTLQTIFYLGLVEIALGLTSAFFLGYGLEFWALGFGIMHIIYGTLMYLKYDKK